MKEHRKNRVLIQVIAVVAIAFGAFAGLGVINQVQAAASLYIGASATTVYQGGTFTIYPRVNTGGSPTNAYAVNMTFPGIIQPISASKGGSICTLYTAEPSYTSSTATVSCGLPSPGYNGSAGGLGSFTFRAVSKGTATISITGSSQVLANDGVGTNILGSRGSVAINIVDPPPPPIGQPEVTCKPGKDGEWISSDKVECSWTTPNGASGFSYIITKDQNENPPRSNMGGDTSHTFSDLKDGTYYIKVMATDGSRWGNPTTYTLKVDTTPPEKLEIVSDPSADQKIDQLPLISFNATDATSGVDYYMIRIDDGEWVKTKSPYQIEEISSGTHTIYVKAVDMAGNETVEGLDLTIAELLAPVIIKPEQGAYIPIGEKLVVEGTTSPESTVYIYLDGELIGEVTSNEDGKFKFTYDKILTEGSYELYAVSKDDGGILSQKSEIIKFNIDLYAVRIGRFVVPSICVGSSILIALILLIIVIIILWRRYKSYRRKVKENVGNAQKVVDDEFDELEKDMREDVEKILSKDMKKSDIRKVENTLEKELTEEIVEAEKDIEKAIDKVEPVKEHKKPRRKKKKKKGIPAKDIPPNEDLEDTLT